MCTQDTVLGLQHGSEDRDASMVGIWECANHENLITIASALCGHHHVQDPRMARNLKFRVCSNDKYVIFMHTYVIHS